MTEILVAPKIYRHDMEFISPMQINFLHRTAMFGGNNDSNLLLC